MIEDSGVIFRNPLPGHRVINAFYPMALPLDDGELLCVLRVAGALYSPDGMLRARFALASDDGLVWRGTVPVEPRSRRALLGARASFLPAETRHHGVERDPVDPRRQRGVAPKGLDLLVDLQQDVLGHFLRVLVVSGIPKSELEDLSPVIGREILNG